MQSSASRSVARKYNITAIDEQNAHCDHHSGQGIIKSHNLFNFDKFYDSFMYKFSESEAGRQKATSCLYLQSLNQNH